jgi:hypothetical protein
MGDLRRSSVTHADILHKPTARHLDNVRTSDPDIDQPRVSPDVARWQVSEVHVDKLVRGSTTKLTQEGFNNGPSALARIDPGLLSRSGPSSCSASPDYSALVAKWRRLQGSRSTQQPYGKHYDAAQQSEYAIDGNAHEPKRNQKDPDEGIGDQRQ